MNNETKLFVGVALFILTLFFGQVISECMNYMETKRQIQNNQDKSFFNALNNNFLLKEDCKN